MRVRPSTSLAAAAFILIACSGSVPAADPDAGDTDPEGGAGDPLDDFFGLELHDIRIQLDPDAVDDLIAAPREYTHGAIEIDDAAFEDVGVRLKGGAGSFVPWGGDYPEISGDGNGNPGKNALIVDFNRWVKGVDLMGLEKLTMNNLVQDPTCVHEFLGYTLFCESGIPASRSGFAIVTVNGEQKGIYALVETPDNDEFLEEHFGSDDGNLYEGEYGTDFSVETIDGWDQDNGDDESRSDLIAVATALDGIGDDADPMPTLEEHFDMEGYAAFAAAEIFLGHWDGYAQSANNFAVYHNPEDGMWTFLPWGLDQLFEHEGPHGGIMTGPGPAWDGGGRIQRLCFRSDECRALLADAFEDLFQTIAEIGYAQTAQAALDLVGDQAMLEATTHGDPELTEVTMARVLDRIDTRPEEISGWLPCLTGGSVDHDEDSFDGCTSDCDDLNPERHPGAEEMCNFVDDDCNGVIDDPTECPKCMEEGDLSYCFEALSWADAEQACVDLGRHLASIHSDQDQESAVWPMVEMFGAWESWIGLNDLAAEGDFVWTDGTALDFEPWIGGTPWAETPECDCVVNSPEGWRDVPCEEPRPFVCGGP